MAMTGGIGYEIDQLAKLGVPELMRRQRVDPQLKYALALQEATKLVEAAARERDMAQQMPMPADVVGQMETSLAKRLAPGVQQQGRRSVQMQNRAAMGLPGQAAPNMARMADGGIVGYADGGPAQSAMLTETQKYLDAQRTLNDPNASQQDKVFAQGVLDSLRPVQQGGNVDPNTYAQMRQQLEKIRAARAGEKPANSMATGGVVSYARGGEIDMDALLDALMIAESGGDPRAVSSAGAEGAYQIMPSTAAQPGFGVSPMEGSRFDPEASRKFARQYLQAMIDRYDGDIEAALVAYNAGPGNADKFIAAGKDYDVLPRAMQTKPYVNRILGDIEKEDRRRDIQLAGGRTISTTAPESYTERMRRQSADRVRAMETASMPPRPPAETEIYQPNIPDAPTVARAQQELREPGSPSGEYTAAEREAGGIGYLQYLARKEKERKDREASRAARYLKMMQGQEDIIRRANPAMGLAGIDTNQEFTTERSRKSPAQRLEEAVPGLGAAAARYAMSKNAPEAAAARIDERQERTRSNNPLVNLRSDLGEIGSYLRDILGFQEGGEVKKYAGEDESLVELTGGRTISTTAPESYTERRRREARERAERSLAEQYPPREAEPAEMYEPSLGDVMLIQQAQEYLTDPRIRELQEIIRRGGQDYKVEAARQELESRRREIARTPIEEVPAEELTMAQKLMQLPRVERQPRQEQPAPKKGIAGLLDKIGGTQGLLNVAEVLGRGAGASKGFEAAKIVEESAKARAAQQARQDQLDKLREQLEVEREKIAATQAAAEVKALADLNEEQRKAVGEFLALPATQARMAEIQEQLGVESVYDPSVLAAIQPEISAYLSARGMAGSVGGMGGLGTQPGISEADQALIDQYSPST